MNEPQHHAYSVRTAEDDSVTAADWRWSDPTAEVWKRSYQESGQWVGNLDLDEKGRMALLAHFGLTEIADKFPLKTICAMPPYLLIQERRMLEQCSGNVVELHPVSDTMGDHYPAELAA